MWVDKREKNGYPRFDMATEKLLIEQNFIWISSILLYDAIFSLNEYRI